MVALMSGRRYISGRVHSRSEADAPCVAGVPGHRRSVPSRGRGRAAARSAPRYGSDLLSLPDQQALPSCHTDTPVATSLTRARKLRYRYHYVLCWYFAVFGTWLLFGELTVSPDRGLQHYWRIGWSIIIIVGCLRATRLRIEVDDEGIAAFNFFSTQRTRWSEIVNVSAQPFGLWISLKGGKFMTATAFAKPNVPGRTKADRVAAQLTAEALRRRK